LVRHLRHSVIGIEHDYFFGSTEMQHDAPECKDRLLITCRQAAQLLSVSERHLFAMTQSGQLPCVRLGKCVRYEIDKLRQWLADRVQQSVTGAI
jgi:excisionase family DNA binding protein